MIVRALMKEDERLVAWAELMDLPTDQEGVIPEVMATFSELTKEEQEAWEKLDRRERDRLMSSARKLHLNTAHRHTDILAESLKKIGAKPECVAAMKQLKCSACHESSEPQPRMPAQLQEAREPWTILSMDLKEYSDEKTGKKVKDLYILDEATRFLQVIELWEIPLSKHRNATSREIIEAYEKGWAQMFGDPRVIRHDAEGALTSTEITQFWVGRGIRLDQVPGEAHEQIGGVERAIQTIMRSAVEVQRD